MITGIDPSATDTGIEGQPDMFVDRITSDTATGFVGLAETNAIVRLYVEDDADHLGDPCALTVAVPLDGNVQFFAGQWNTSYVFDLNDPNLWNSMDGLRQVSVTAEDVAGNVSEPDELDIFIDTRGPQVDDVTITDNSDYDLFNPKPSEDGPTPLVFSLDIDFIDRPNRVDDGVSVFVYPAVNEILATAPGNIQVVGDANGVIPIESIDFLDYTVAGDIGRTTIRLNFFDPLPDDRFTLTVSDRIEDAPGNALDGESNTAEPQEIPLFPSGDGDPGEDFVARFTVDSRPEIGVWSAGSVYVDTNGNFIFDPQNLDHTNRDLIYILGYTSDYVFAGNFSLHSCATADGFDKLAAYGIENGQARWLVDTDNDGVPNVDVDDPANIIGMPVAGNFDDNALNGDEVGLFDGTTWFLDQNHNFQVDDDAQIVIPGMSGGYPIVGDFDGDGHDDLATYDLGLFTFALSDGVGGWLPLQTIQFNYQSFIGVRERPVAADMNQDGIDDLGLWAPDRSGAIPEAGGEWYFLISDEALQADGSVAPLDHHFSPFPLGNDLFAQFGDEFGVPVVGNFDPPVAGEGEFAGSAILNLLGTPGDDVLEFTAGSTPGAWTVTLNGVLQDQVSGDALALTFDGLGGNDTVLITGSDGTVETAVLWAHEVTFTGAGHTAHATNVEDINVTGGREDVASLHDTDASETLTVDLEVGRMILTDDATYHNQIEGFGNAHAYAKTSKVDPAVHDYDQAFFLDSVVKDTLKLKAHEARLINTLYGYNYRAKFFETVTVDATRGGNDFARIWDSPGNDEVTTSSTRIDIRSADGSYDATAAGFENTVIYSTVGGYDTVQMYDSPRDDVFCGYSYKSVFSYAENNVHTKWMTVRAFNEVYAHAVNGGYDKAKFWDTAADDHLQADYLDGESWARLSMNRSGSLNHLFDALAFEFIRINDVNDSDRDTKDFTAAVDFVFFLHDEWIDEVL